MYPLGVLINNYCCEKSQMRLTRDLFFADLSKKLNSLTFRFCQVTSRHKLSVSHEKNTTKDPRPNN